MTKPVDLTTGTILIRREKLHQMVPLSVRTIYDLEQRNEFPRRIALTSRCVVWKLHEVEDWIASRAGITARRPGPAVDS
jgi:prophage regulatory protein